jgi:hypothetical protein
MAAAIGALLVAGLLVSGCASDSERDWQVAANPRATADEIIDAGHAAGIATSEDQMVVTWEVEPEDDEGPYQGAWRLYDRDKGKVADGKFGTVREASARIDVVAVRDGFLLTDYADQKPHFLDRSGKLTPAKLAAAKPGPSLAGGVLGPDQLSEEEGWQVVLPDKRQVVRLTDLPTKDVQGIQLTSDGTVWVLLPWTSAKGPFRIAYAKDGKAPWTTETIPMPNGSGTFGDGISAHGDKLFVVASHSRGERMTVDAILSREAGEKGWERIDASGIAGNLIGAPRIAVLPKGRLVAMASGEGAWVQKSERRGFTALHPPSTHKHSTPDVQKEGIWLWSSEQTFGKSLHYSYDYGKTWRTFYR